MKTISVISIPVKDQQKAKEFYLLMGFELIMETPFDKGQYWIQLGLPGGGPTITLVTWFDKMPAGSLQGILIETEDILKDIEHLKGKGIETGALDETPWGKFASIKDLDGNSWSLHQKTL